MRIISYGALLVGGFVLGTLGITAYTKTPIESMLTVGSDAEVKNAPAPIAHACTAIDNHDDIFFLSCGGIF